MKGTHVFIPEGKAVEDVMREHRFGSTQKESKTKGYYGDEEGVAGLISKQKDKGELDKITEMRKHLEEQSNKIKKELKGKYKREDVEFDEEQLKKDIREAQSFGYEEVEDIAEFLGLDEDEVRETLANAKDSITNSKEQDMTILEELKRFITKVENEKGENMGDEKKKDVENEKVDKRKLIDEVAGMMKSAGCDDEVIRTAIGKMEKISYDESEAGTADNKKAKNEDEKEDDKKAENKCKNENEEDEKKVEEVKEDVKEDVENKCKNSIFNSKENFFEKLNAIYNSANEVKENVSFKTREERLEAGKKF